MKATRNKSKGHRMTPVCSTEPGRVREEIPMQEEQDRIKAGSTSSLLEVSRRKYPSFVIIEFTLLDKYPMMFTNKTFENRMRFMKVSVDYGLIIANRVLLC
jgi:hypothetical protein